MTAQLRNKKKSGVKKTVTFSDDTTISKSTNKKKTDFMSTNPPVFVRKTPLTIPWHLIGLLIFYIKVSKNYNGEQLLLGLIPMQILYLIFQFNKSTIYGKKRLKMNTTLLLLSIVGSVAMSIPAMAIAILLGAPLVEHLRSTWLMALHSSFLAFPALYSVVNCDFKVTIWRKYFIAIVVGGWISCIVIPLDWDRDWQAWPIPVIVGTYLGAFVGYTIGAFL
ncbi:mannose-ethanolamine phosphotransferase GPI11 KNAG_0M01570 [Huiozyma naganishii CBS 8797]|uniref:Glycosylphosphatidylinositol anchor biosynthesis protein 11 n=1 Tax=Huiozyma naganishii (strain ATCC MYA-139 / BCRC 22969 / CBS 8797 / KCTC 17520 / NBRC 10181 / NCYC 3082 / Yp74L-3) TaxID=1071383 RepID=J7RDV1_HUIN7|nr:hypothetical protein KNAG_0M01570 [Kazachstania naganishii CBS 8797]CCK73010.1 hypothetical protein KNAG_0M01570 [Kazachstania naganishii CBS 8797]